MATVVELESLMLPENGQDFDSWMAKWMEEKQQPQAGLGARAQQDRREQRAELRLRLR